MFPIYYYATLVSGIVHVDWCFCFPLLNVCLLILFRYVYRKWNKCLFEELYLAHLNGRMENDPATFWYKGEFGFFDFYMYLRFCIPCQLTWPPNPLSHTLAPNQPILSQDPSHPKIEGLWSFWGRKRRIPQLCQKNRAEWELKGQAVIAEMVEECHRKYGVKNADGMVVPAETGVSPWGFYEGQRS